MLSACELGDNAIRQISDTKGMASFSLAKIADYLNCSVDYLLGRTDDPTNATLRGFNSLNSEGQSMVMEYIRVLMNVLNKLVDKGNTVIVIEHNLDVIKMADYIIDMGPEGGKGGGELLSCGTPEEVAESTKGYTPKFLKEELHL